MKQYIQLLLLTRFGLATIRQRQTTDGFIIWSVWFSDAHDILYGARQLPERSFLPVVGQD